MKPPQYFITLFLSALCILLSILVFWQQHSFNSSLTDFNKNQSEVQGRVQDDQAKINKGNQVLQAYNNIIKDIANGANYDPATGKAKDKDLDDLLKKYGFTVKVQQPSPSPSPAASSTPTPR